MPDWNTLFTLSEYRWQQPHELLPEFTRQLHGLPAARVLDLCCGAGRHVVALARQGLDTTGCDISENGLRYTRKWLDQCGLAAHLDQMDMTHLGYPDSFFDGVISLFALYHNPLEKMRQTLAEVERILKPGGYAWLVFMSKRGYRYGRGEQIEPDTFITIDGDDAGEVHHYSDLSEFDRELGGFIIQRVIYHEEPAEGGRVHSHWYVWMQKPV